MSLPRVLRALFAVALVLPLGGELAVEPAVADEAPPATQPNRQPGSPQDRLNQYVALQRELLKLFQMKDYAGAAEACRKMIELAPRDPSPHYNLACAQARIGKLDDAFASLGRAIELGWADADHTKADPDLEGLRADRRFDELLAKARAEAVRQAEARYEKGAPIEGVKTLEGNPADGMRWRLRMDPKATRDNPNRLVIWLHPSGGSMNGVVERMGPMLIKQGFALLLPTAKDWRSWSAGDADKLLGPTLADVAKVEGIDANRPVLLGYSAGGQMALYLWSQAPEKFAGLVLDAAYPIERTGPGQIKLLTPPKGERAVRTCPFFVLVGDRDSGSQVWLKGEDAYRRAGVPLTIHYVPGQGHTWLFGGAQREKLSAWLGQIAAGKVPGAPASQPATAPAPDRPIEPEDIY